MKGYAVSSIEIGDFEVGIIDEEAGWYEHNELGDELGGELIFENGELVDFDGAMSLPLNVADGIEKLGLKVDKKHFCIGE